MGPDPHLGERSHPVPLLLTSLSAPSPHAGTPARMRCRWQRRGRGPAPVAGRPQSADSAREAAAAASLEAEPALGCERRQDAGSGRVRSAIRDPLHARDLPSTPTRAWVARPSAGAWAPTRLLALNATWAASGSACRGCRPPLCCRPQHLVSCVCIQKPERSHSAGCGRVSPVQKNDFFAECSWPRVACLRRTQTSRAPLKLLGAFA